MSSSTTTFLDMGSVRGCEDGRSRSRVGSTTHRKARGRPVPEKKWDVLHRVGPLQDEETTSGRPPFGVGGVSERPRPQSPTRDLVPEKQTSLFPREGDGPRGTTARTTPRVDPRVRGTTCFVTRVFVLVGRSDLPTGPPSVLGPVDGGGRPWSSTPVGRDPVPGPVGVTDFPGGEGLVW